MCMDKCSSTSKSAVRCLRAALMAAVLLLCPALGSCAGGATSFADYSGYVIMPADRGDTYDCKWADYLATHLMRRAGLAALILRDDKPEALHITVDYDARLKGDYRVVRTGDDLSLSARNKESMLWLLYQFMSAAGADDDRLSVVDLPPALLDMDHDGEVTGTFAFEYRGIYTPSNQDEDFMPILATHNVDYDWGLWGHNLRKLFDGGIPTEMRALVNGHRVNDQFCFSSPALYDALVRYVLDNYGAGEAGSPVRFAIFPEDNDEVCTCPACRAAGNTADNASPAVARLLTRLAHRFPHHQFYTSAYLTTRKAPAEPLPDNAGVILSAIDCPMQLMKGEEPEKAALIALITEWRRVTPLIYVWDYVRNFDDYLTPYPCLHLLQERLKLYRDRGVRGIFLNGSGYDYATFDDVQTYVASALMISPDLSVDTLVTRYFRHYYPVTGGVLTDYYLSLEHAAVSGYKVLPFYGGIDDAVAYGLSPQELEKFVKTLDQKAKKATGDERTRLNKLLTALQFTRLELLRRTPGQYEGRRRAEPLAALRGHTAFDDMKNYREAHGEIDQYIGEWESLLRFTASRDNRLKGTRLGLSDEGHDPAALTDGLYGFPSDYHTNWVIRRGGLGPIALPAGSLSSGSVLEVSFLHAPLWHIYSPQRVELWQGGRCVATAEPRFQSQDTFVRALARLSTSQVRPESPAELRVIQAETEDARAQVGCDEVAVY